jgi:hypothetical protein
MLLRLLLPLVLLSGQPASLGRCTPRLLVAATRAAGPLRTGQSSQALLVGAGGAGAAGGRWLVQAQVAAADGVAAPTVEQAAASGSVQAAPEAEQGQQGEGDPAQACLALQVNFSASCQVSIDRLALYFPRGSTELPTQEQLDQALAALRAGGLPAAGCCQFIGDILAARCGCNRYGAPPPLPVAVVLPALRAVRRSRLLMTARGQAAFTTPGSPTTCQLPACPPAAVISWT